jgi:hypothetical protein
MESHKMLMKISEFREAKFTKNSRPSVNTIKKWVDNGTIVGEIYDGMYFIHTDKIQPVNDLVHKVLL